MITFTNEELFALVSDDVPYLDLTTHLQEKNNIKAKLELFTREDLVLSCTEESKKIAELYDCVVSHFLPSKTRVKKGDKIFEIVSSYENIHKIWRSVQLIIEYSSKIATYTNMMKNEIETVNSSCQLLSTRKSFPFAKKLCIKSVLVGGGFIHRLNLSESILFFANHRVVYKDDLEFYSNIKTFKEKMPEKKVVVESSTYEDSKELLNFGVDVLQLDKMSIEDIIKVVELRNKSFANRQIICSGGINLKNAKIYAKTGIDAIVTSSMYISGMADIKSRVTTV